jgi:uncharacterized protein (TIGR02391 family)
LTNSQPSATWWIPGVAVDEELERLAKDVSQPDVVIREAFLILERRIRQATGLSAHDFGAELVDKAFLPDRGVLRDVSPISAEQKGFHELFHGAFMYYRNPVSHRNVFYGRETQIQVLNLVNHLLGLVQIATDASVDIRRYVGRYEGNITHRRNYRLDIDGDNENEIVSLVSTQPVLMREQTDPKESLITVILDRVGGEWRRIPADKVNTLSMYGPANVTTMNITGSDRQDLVVSWFLGENGVGWFILRWEADRYVLVRNKEIPYGEIVPNPGLEGFYEGGTYLASHFGDFDGDGLVEVESCEAVYGEDQLTERGYSFDLEKRNRPIVAMVCSMWKWDASERLMVPVIETAPINDWIVPKYCPST